MKVDNWLNPNCSEITMRVNGNQVPIEASESIEDVMYKIKMKYRRKSKTLKYDDTDDKPIRLHSLMDYFTGRYW